MVKNIKVQLCAALCILLATTAEAGVCDDPGVPRLFITPKHTKTFQFHWTEILGATHYLAVGVPQDGAARGVRGDPGEGNASNSGAVFLY